MSLRVSLLSLLACVVLIPALVSSGFSTAGETWLVHNQRYDQQLGPVTVTHLAVSLSEHP